MKHLKKKFTAAIQLDASINDALDQVKLSEDDRRYVRENARQMNAMILTDTNEVLQAFVYSYDGKHLAIPEPDPVIIHFNSAIINCNNIISLRPTLLKSFQDQTVDIGINASLFYEFFSGATATITFLYNSLEAFVNRIIPEEFIYPKKNKSLDKEKIQRYIQMEEKIKFVVPQALEKAFHLEFPSDYEIFLLFKKFRDELIHTKSNERAAMAIAYKSIYTLALDFDYLAAIHCIRDYINYYQPNLIEECPCENNP